MQHIHWKWIVCGFTAGLLFSGCDPFKSSHPFKGKTIGAIDKSNALPADEFFKIDYQAAKKYIGKEITISGLRQTEIWMEDTSTGHISCEVSFSNASDSIRATSRNIKMLFFF